MVAGEALWESLARFPKSSPMRSAVLEPKPGSESFVSPQQDFKNKRCSQCSPGPELSWGVQPSGCPSASPADLSSAATFSHVGHVCVWL